VGNNDKRGDPRNTGLYHRVFYGEKGTECEGVKARPFLFLEVIKMGMMKRKLDDKKIFLGNLTEKEFYDRLHFNRKNGFNRGQK
jgi:hypothetical protein